VKKALLLAQLGATIIAVLLGSGVSVAAPDGVVAPPKELVQYISAAKRSGLKDNIIRRDAVTAGWPAEVVDQAFASLAGSPKVQSDQRQTPTPAVPPETPASTPSPTPASVPADQAPPAPLSALVPAGQANPSPEAKNRGVPDDYRIGAGDVLQISVWKEPDASVGSVVVRPDGKITVPIIKEIEVLGLTPTEAEKAITERLDKLIQGVDVTVIVKDIQSKKLYVIGAVKKEGIIQYTYRMSVMQALTESGGLTDYAKRKKIYILRNEGGKDYRLLFDYDAVIKGEKMEQNIQLLPGDTIVVPH
jgi:polysaccharide export outer membrane protein